MKNNMDTLKSKNITLMRPVYDKIDFIDFHKYDAIIEIWYNAAKKQLW